MSKVLTLIDLFYFLVDCLIIFFILFLFFFSLRLKSNCVRKYKNLLSSRTDMTTRGPISWSSEYWSSFSAYWPSTLFDFKIFWLHRVKDLTNAKAKLEAHISEREETIATLKKKINGLVSIEMVLKMVYVARLQWEIVSIHISVYMYSFDILKHKLNTSKIYNVDPSTTIY